MAPLPMTFWFSACDRAWTLALPKIGLLSPATAIPALVNARAAATTAQAKNLRMTCSLLSMDVRTSASVGIQINSPRTSGQTRTMWDGAPDQCTCQANRLFAGYYDNGVSPPFSPTRVLHAKDALRRRECNLRVN